MYLKPQDLIGSPRKRESIEEDQRLNAVSPNIRQNMENPAKGDFKVVASQVEESFHVFRACNVQGQDCGLSSYLLVQVLAFSSKC